jgi:uncharacterized membrane protein
MGHRHPVNIDAYDRRSKTDQKVDSFVAGFGSLKFIIYQTIIIIFWIIFNCVGIFGLKWDPYPFILLNLVFSTQAAYAAPLILLSQNRQAEVDRQKAENDFEVNQIALNEIREIKQLIAGKP